MKPSESVTTLKGVGPKKAKALEKMGIRTIEDLIYLFPRDYQDRRTLSNIADLREDETVCILGKITRKVQSFYGRRRKQSLRLYVSDESGGTQILFFNATYLLKYFEEGKRYVFYGKVSRGRLGLQMVHPDFCREEDREEGIIPVYPLTKGVSQKDIRSWQKQVSGLIDQIPEFYDEDFLKRNTLQGLRDAIMSMHSPGSRDDFLRAKYRMIFDELFLMQAGIMSAGKGADKKDGIAFVKEPVEEEFIESLPFPLTEAQRRCADEIMADLASGRAMNRLLQGDVGSGKTAIAQIAMYKAARSGYQSVMMAPTEILARQHFGSMKEAFEGTDIRVGFLSGGLGAAERRQVLEDLGSGEIDVLIGTHAVIQPDVKYAGLGLVITDEQHRFGVDQRIKLRQKGEAGDADSDRAPNVMVMTATPIPRTLAVVLYGDLDISVIDQMPPGRKPIITRSLTAKHRDRCYELVEDELAAGRQAYVVTPLIEESEALDVKSAQEVASELTERFDGVHGHRRFRVALLHGAMKQREKDEVMSDFAKGLIDVLVATVVIEVGINVPNASVMVIENAERFGLAQMHQLRGRVGRGSDQSYCYLLLDGGGEISEKRCQVMEESTDGFFIADEDLKLRGPGDLFGTRQHGLPQLTMADLIRHRDIMKHAGDEAKRLLEADPGLTLPEHAGLRERIDKMFSGDIGMDL